MDLEPYTDTWEANDPHANFKEEVFLYSVVDPLPTLENLSKDTGIPLPALVRYILVKYTASGSDAVLTMTPYALRQMQDHINKAEKENSTEARLAAYESLRNMITWLALGPR